MTINTSTDDYVPTPYYPDNQPPVVEVSEQSVDRAGKKTIDVSTGVAVMHLRYDIDPSATTVIYKVEDLQDDIVYQGSNPKVPVEILVRGIYFVTVTVTDSAGASTEETYRLDVTDSNFISNSVSASA
ncbi:TPA: hypothetical protein ACHU3A_002313, partial [Streptococcus suis]